MAKKSCKPEIPIICYSLEDPEKPNHDKRTIDSLADVLEWEHELRKEFFVTNAGDRLKEIWFRGTRKHFPLAPGIYRQNITDLATDKNRDSWYEGSPSGVDASELEIKRLNIEREMILAFEREAGPLLQHKSEQELYFLARHYGMPSRLLDWSISPLIALFMCVFPEPKRPVRGKGVPQDQPEQEGVIYAMDPEQLDPPGYICDQYDPMVKEAVEVVTEWNNKGYDQERDNPAILPIRPHTLVGRIDRQLSRFTLHSFGAKAQKNDRLRSCCVPTVSKDKIRGQLERIGVNEFSAYYTLDRLVSDITDRFSSFRL